MQTWGFKAIEIDFLEPSVGSPCGSDPEQEDASERLRGAPGL